MTIPPLLLTASVNPQFMVSTLASFQDLAGPVSMLIDNNNMNTILYDTTCVMASTLATSPTSLNCTDSPCFLTEVDTSAWLGGVPSSGSAGGYSGSGLLYSEPQSLTNNQYFSTNVLVVNNIATDSWLYNVSNNGALGFANSQSGWLSNYGNLWSIEVGPVANQSFTGQNFQIQNTSLYIGSGDYSNIFTGTSVNSLTLDNSAGLQVQKAWFGQNIQTGSFYSPLGYSQSSLAASIQLNFQGLGLPNYEWVQVVNLLGKIPNIPAEDLICFSGLGSMCHLAQPCSTSAYASLWTYSFMIQFVNQTNYVTVNFGSFAIDNVVTGMCDLYIQRQNSIIFGSMFMQNFVAFFNGSDVSLMPSTNYGLPGTSINDLGPVSNMTTPFSYVSSTLFELLITTNGLSSSLSADLGLQGQVEFMVSFSTGVISTFSTNCTTGGGTGGQNCSVKPNYANQYFNMSHGNATEYTTITPDGYTTDGGFFTQIFCLPSQVPGTGIFCTNENEEFFVADVIKSNDWRYEASAFAGIIGLAQGSPVWSLIDPTNTGNYFYYLHQIPQDGQIGTLELGLCGSSCNNQSFVKPNITIKPHTISSQTFELSSFSFGLVNFTADIPSQDTFSIINDNATIYGVDANMATFTLDFRGIGLPTTSYAKFVNLLSIASNGQVDCIKTQGGFCSLPGNCSSYSFITDYSFMASFVGDSNYLTIPLAFFARTTTYSIQGLNTTQCAIYVEMLDESLADSSQIVFGQSFFNAFSFFQAQSNTTSIIGGDPTQFYSQYIGNATLVACNNCAFNIEQHQLNVLGYTGLAYPYVSLNAGNYPPEVVPYFMMDFNAQKSATWELGCEQNLLGFNQFCSFQPVGVAQQYNASLFVAPVGINNLFTDLSFGGYQCSGEVVTDYITWDSFGNKYIEMYAVNMITQDSWLYGQGVNGPISYGVLGLGPTSAFWNQFINPSTGIASFYIALNSNQSLSNVTLGYQGAIVQNSSFVSLTSPSNDAVYALQTFGYGTVYAINNISVSSYFNNMTTSSGIQFSINFLGMGLPQTLWEEWSALFLSYKNGTTCSSSNVTGCQITGPCSSHVDLLQFSFQIIFPNSVNYLRIPLSAFASDDITTNTCNFEIQYLNSSQVESNNIILGVKFFEQFQGYFTNNYTSLAPSTQYYQTAQIYLQSDNSVAFIGSEQLTTGKNPFVGAPVQYPSTVTPTFMPYITAQFGVEPIANYLIDNNIAFSYAWTTDCVQSDTLKTGLNANCSDSPSFVTESLDQTLIPGGIAYPNTTAGGYLTSGNDLLNNFTFNNSVGSSMTIEIDVHAVTQIYTNEWMYGVASVSGALALGPGSQWMKAMQDQTTQKSLWSIEIGNVADQQFAGSQLTTSQTNLFMGPGNYLYYYNVNYENMITVDQNVQTGLYNLDQAWFGQITSNGSYWEKIGYDMSNTTASLSLNFQGLGLPYYEWNQIVTLLSKINSAISNDLTCSSEAGGMCSLKQSCNSTAYQELWNYFFKVQFDIFVPTYTTVNFGSFAVNGAGGSCDLYVKRLATGNNVVLGSMWLQNFVAFFEQDNASTIATQQVSFIVSQYALPGATINQVGAVNDGQNAFSYLPTSLVLPVNVDALLMVATIQANLGYQGFVNFQASLLGSLIQTYSTNCKYGTTATTCSEFPNYATDYWNMDLGISTSTSQESVNYEGYYSFGYFYKQAVCLQSESNTQNLLCSIPPQEFFVANEIVQNAWNFGSTANAGIIGFGSGSPIWSFVSTGPQILSIQFQNVTNWAFVNASYVPTILGNSITLGEPTSNPYFGMENITITTSVAKGKSYLTSQFTFGMINSTSNEFSWQSINNDDSTAYGVYTNTTTFDLDVRGLGLPPQSFARFSNLMNIITNGGASCTQTNGGYCVLQNSCASYPALWQYSFQIQFTTANTQTLIVPLATFATEQMLNGTSFCAIFVEELGTTDEQQSIFFGQMFFQSVSYYYNDGTVTLYQNLNALSGTFLGTLNVTPSPSNAFDVTPVYATNDLDFTVPGLPAFTFQIENGYTSLYSQNISTSFLLDFQNSLTVVWDINCTQTVFGSGPCSQQPTYLQTSFSSTSQIVGEFVDYMFGGYKCSGNIYVQTICMYGTCKLQQIYSANLITQNNWHFNQNGTFGIIGLGVYSKLWNQWITVDGFASNSVSLARTAGTLSAQNPKYIRVLENLNPFKQFNQAALPISNVTLGSTGNTAAYVGQTSMTLNTTIGTGEPLYNANKFGFGLVYNSPSSQYFSNFSSNGAITTSFSTNFQGLGLTSTMYTQYTQLLTNLTGATNITCAISNGGFCVLKGNCQNYNYLDGYTFQVVYQEYIQVPISAFAQDENGNCNILVTNLEPQQNPGVAQVIFGGMFFTEFFGATTTQYLYINQTASSQSIQLFIQLDSIWNATYIGNRVLPQGNNPFSPIIPIPIPVPNKASIVWIIILCVIIVLLAGFLGWAVWKWRKTVKEQDAKRNIVYGTNDTELNPSGKLLSDSEL